MKQGTVLATALLWQMLYFQLCSTMPKLFWFQYFLRNSSQPVIYFIPQVVKRKNGGGTLGCEQTLPGGKNINLEIYIFIPM